MNANPRFKEPPIRDRKWLDYVRTMPCFVTGREGESEPAHLRLLGMGGTGTKPGDNFVLPLHWKLHRLQSEIGEPRSWLSFAQEYPEFYFRMLLEKSDRKYREFRGYAESLRR